MARQTFRDIPVEYNGRVQTLKQWVEELGLDYSVVTARYRYGKTIETGLFAPTNRAVQGADLRVVRQQAVRTGVSRRHSPRHTAISDGTILCRERY